MNRWLGSMGLSSGGRLTFFTDQHGHEIRSQGGFVKTAISMSGMLGDQPGLWQDKVLDTLRHTLTS